METKINELVDAYNRVNTDHKEISAKIVELERLVDYLIGAGLEAEVKKQLEKWLADGTLAGIIGDALTAIQKRLTTLEDKAANIMLVDDFGAIGDGVTDDTEAFKNAMAWSRQTGREIYLNEKIYKITSVDVSKAKVRSLSGVPGGADPMFLCDKEGTPIFGGASNWNYYYNKDLGLITWSDMIKRTAYGCCIVSETNGPILYTDKESKLDLDGFAIIGNHRQRDQYGIYVPVPTKYIGADHKLSNIMVKGCGNDGIRLESGLEVVKLFKVSCSTNNGNGLYIGYSSTVDTPFEYVDFDKCSFGSNRLNGVYCQSFRKHITFTGTGFGANGQYQVNEVDPVLGYDRRVPTSREEMKAGVWINDGNLNNVNSLCHNFSMENCYGEMIAKALHFRCSKGSKIVNNLFIKNNTFFRSNVLSEANNGVVYYFDIGYASNWSIDGTFQHALKLMEFKTIPSNGGEVNIYDLDVPQELRESSFYKKKTSMPQDINANINCKRIYDNKNLLVNLEGTGNDIPLDKIKLDFTKSTSVNNSNLVAVYSLSAHWQATNANNFGAYILFVTKMPNGKYQMITFAASKVDGFSSAPTIQDDGILVIPSAQYYRYTLTRLDNALTA